MNQIPEGWERGTHHAPVPWKADGCRIESVACYPPDPVINFGRPLLEIYDEGGHTEADAEFICRAVNCHDELLRCLREAVEYADSTHVIPSVEMMTAWDAAIEKATPPTVEASAAI